MHTPLNNLSIAESSIHCLVENDYESDVGDGMLFTVPGSKRYTVLFKKRTLLYTDFVISYVDEDNFIYLRSGVGYI